MFKQEAATANSVLFDYPFHSIDHKEVHYRRNPLPLLYPQFLYRIFLIYKISDRRIKAQTNHCQRQNNFPGE